MGWDNRNSSYQPPSSAQRATSIRLQRWRRWPPNSDLGCSAFCGLQTRQPGLPPLDEFTQQRRVVSADSGTHRWPRREVFPPACDRRLSGQNTEIADLVKGIEIAEHGTEHGVDEREFFAVEPGRRDEALLQPRNALLELGDFRVERRLILGGIETRDIVEHGRAEFDPAAVLGTRERFGRMQRRGLRLLQIFE